jgi:diguanylate cyclase (GGDEF)-like protein
MSEQSEQKLSALRDYYIRQLKTSIYKQTLKVDATTSQSTLNELGHYLHKLAGSGGSFGLPFISKVSKSAEELLASTAWQNETERERQTEHLNEFLQQLENQIGALDYKSGVQTSTGSEFTQGKPGYTEKDANPLCLWILDDDESLLNQLREQLLSFGFDVRIFSTFNAMQERWASEQPDFLIADINLGGDNDFYQLKASHQLDLGSTGLVVVSSFDNFRSRIQAVRENAITYLQKPVDSTRLAHLLREYQHGKKPKPERVLLIDDDANLTELYKFQLEAAGMQVATLTDPTRVIASIQEHRPELIFIDLYMPDYSGMELASLIRQFDAYTSTPIIYLSSEADHARQAAALERGADDFLTKPISELALVAAVRTRVKRARDLQALINKDSLTGLLKHSSIKNALAKELSRSLRSKEPLCAAMLDIDHFKQVNDNYGHAVGDTVIASLATLLSQRLRQSDHIGRYGGEEFLIVMPACDAHSAQRVLDDIRERFSAIKFVSGSQSFTCTLSAGFAITNDKNADKGSTETVIETADNALYYSKNNGRNLVTKAG